MTSLAARFVRNRDSAEDVVQSAFEKAIRGLEKFDGRSQLSTWLHRIVVNESLMWLRSETRRRKRFLPECDSPVSSDAWRAPDVDPEDELVRQERLARLRSGLAALPAPERDVLTACAIDGRTYSEYGSSCGIGAAAAKSRAFRARRRLRDWLENSEFQPHEKNNRS